MYVHIAFFHVFQLHSYIQIVNPCHLFSSYHVHIHSFSRRSAPSSYSSKIPRNVKPTRINNKHLNPRCWYQFKPLDVRLQALALRRNPMSQPPRAERRRIANRTRALNKQPLMKSASRKESGSLSPSFDIRGLLLVSLQKGSCKNANSGHCGQCHSLEDPPKKKTN